MHDSWVLTQYTGSARDGAAGRDARACAHKIDVISSCLQVSDQAMRKWQRARCALKFLPTQPCFNRKWRQTWFIQTTRLENAFWAMWTFQMEGNRGYLWYFSVGTVKMCVIQIRAGLREGDSLVRLCADWLIQTCVFFSRPMSPMSSRAQDWQTRPLTVAPPYMTVYFPPHWLTEAEEVCKRHAVLFSLVYSSVILKALLFWIEPAPGTLFKTLGRGTLVSVLF